MTETYKIPLSGKRGAGLYTLVDKDTFDMFGHLKWHLNDSGYAVRRTKEGNIRLHRLVAKTPDGLVTDHKNHDRLDNRRSNLRAVTQKQNMENYRGEAGYTFDRSKNKWMVRYKKIFYGRYDTEEKAKEVYRLAKSGVAYKKREHRKNYHLPTGVFKNRMNTSYQAKIVINGERFYLGSFPTIEEAHDAYLERKRG